MYNKYSELAEGQGMQYLNLRVVNLHTTQYIVTMATYNSFDLLYQQLTL